MTYRPLSTKLERPTVILGPRTRHEIQLRIRELRARAYPKIYELAEISRLVMLLSRDYGDD